MDSFSENNLSHKKCKLSLYRPISSELNEKNNQTQFLCNYANCRNHCNGYMCIYRERVKHVLLENSILFPSRKEHNSN